MARRLRARNFGVGLAMNADAYATIGDVDTHAFIQNTGIFTVIVWCRPIVTGQNTYLIGSAVTGVEKGFGFGFVTGGVALIGFANPVTFSKSPDATIKAVPGRWQMMVARSNGTNSYVISQYVDGIRNQTAPTTFTTYGAYGSGSSTRITSIGTLNQATNLSTLGFKGTISEALTYNRQLTDAEVDGIYFDDEVPTFGLVTRTLLDEGSGTTINDSVVGVPAGILSLASAWSTEDIPAARSSLALGTRTLVTARTLVTPTNQNLWIRSSEFGNAQWGTSLATITSDVPGAGNPFSAADEADRINDSVAVSSSFFINNVPTPTIVSATTVGGTIYTVSVYAKAGAKIWLCVAPNNARQQCWFNLSTGQKGSTNTSVGRLAQAYGMEPVPGVFGTGWSRCWVAFQWENGLAPRFYICDADNSLIYTGDGSGNLLLWGAQLAMGQGPIPYVATVAAAVAGTLGRSSLALVSPT
jgi:hypothetical protein